MRDGIGVYMPKSKVRAKRRKALKGRMRFEWGDDNRPSSYAIRRVSQLPIAHGRLWNELTKAQRMGIAVVWEEIRYENVFLDAVRCSCRGCP